MEAFIDVSLPWLLGFMKEIFEQLPNDLNATIMADYEDVVIAILEADEMWDYVGNKKTQQWLWLIMHSKSRQIVAFHIGNRSKASGLALMAKLPEDLKKAIFPTDYFSTYREIIPFQQHLPVGKESGKTS